jgi:hypothetical protein
MMFSADVDVQQSELGINKKSIESTLCVADDFIKLSCSELVNDEITKIWLFGHFVITNVVKWLQTLCRNG